MVMRATRGEVLRVAARLQIEELAAQQALAGDVGAGVLRQMDIVGTVMVRWRGISSDRSACQHAADLDPGDPHVRPRVEAIDMVELRVQLIAGGRRAAGMRHREPQKPGGDQQDAAPVTTSAMPCVPWRYSFPGVQAS